ncbi:hypothetical protein [Vibrio owensii]|uniref:hypothetical protein n=1 Tax=Vibrio owensii TaxID=696485 RepID=UPI0022DE236E|nr:hypothetical protein [Vibrio owensii]MDA0385580.1 hypothetical protein [Vibrio owensii]
MTTILQGLFLVALVTVITALAQVAQLYTSYDELRMNTLTEWAKVHPEQAPVVKAFIQTCLSNSDTSLNPVDLNSVHLVAQATAQTLTTCTEHPLMAQIQYADKQISAVAFPLSLFVK